MRKEIIVVDKKTSGIDGKKPHNLELSRKNIFISDEHAAFTDLGVCLYALFVVHKGAIKEALNNGNISDARLKQLMGEETEKKYTDLEEVWGKKIPRSDITSSYLGKQVVAIVRDQFVLLNDGSGLPLTKK